jgi:hypothetical protein
MDAPLLTYPLAAPAIGGFTEVAPGVRWVRLPLAGPLGHINVWALDDGAGWTLVDTGVGSPREHRRLGSAAGAAAVRAAAAARAGDAHAPGPRRAGRMVHTAASACRCGCRGWNTSPAASRRRHRP